MNRIARVAVLYMVFAVIASSVNLGCQALAIWFYSGSHAIEVSVVFGTGAGLVVKYSLDRRFIFRFQPDSFAHEGKLFILYSFFGVFTTALFLGIEYAFQVAFGTDAMRYVGGAIGLVVGYTTKYHLDKHFVFTRRFQRCRDDLRREPPFKTRRLGYMYRRFAHYLSAFHSSKS